MTPRILATAVAAVTLATGGAAFAHHSLDGEFNQQKPIKIKGTISRVDWINPHVYFTIDVKDAKGKVTQWQAETVPVGMMKAAGVTPQVLKSNGQEVEVAGFAARKGGNLMFGNKLTYADGHVITFVGFKE